MASDKDEVTIPQYSLGQPPKRTGLGGLSMTTTVVVATGFLIFLIVQFMGLGLGTGMGILALTAIVAALVSLQWGNRSLATTGRMWIQHMGRKRANEDVYLSGEFSKVTGGLNLLPGTLAHTDVIEATDTNGQPYAVIVDAPARTATALLDCQLTGQTAMTQDERNKKTAAWAEWLAHLSLSGDIEHVVTVVGNRPGTGQLVAQEVQSIVDEGAPEIAKQIMYEAGQELSVGVPEIVSHIAVTFSVTGESLEDGSFLNQIGTRLPDLYESLNWAGILAVPMNEEELVARTHQFFNPPSEADFETLDIYGEEHGMKWENAGPSFARTNLGTYEHDGSTSVSWEMKDAPRSTFQDTILTNLLAPHPRIARKRVALIYRPYEAGKGVSKVEGEHRDAMVAANSGKSLRSANAELRLEHTEAARRAQAMGAQLGRTSLAVTVTVTDESELGRAVNDVQQLAAGASIQLQRMNRQQDTAFITTLGIGQVPWTRETTDLIP